jgi:hypothetical protein
MSRNISTAQIYVRDVPIQLAPDRIGRKYLILFFNSGSSVFLGDSRVTTTTGVRIDPPSLAASPDTGILTLNNHEGSIYAVSSGASIISILELF